MYSESSKWGWQRLMLGVLQMALSVAAAYCYFYLQFETVGMVLAIAATLATIVSRHVYAGRKAPPSLNEEANAERDGKGRPD